MKRLLFITFLLMATSSFTSIFAGNWTLGLTPVGGQSLKLSFDDPKEIFTYNFRTTVGISIAVESIFQNGIIEFSHYRGILTSSSHEGDKLYMKNEDDHIRVTSFMRYWGKVFNDGKRIQFPIYAGAGVGNIKSGNVHTLSLEVGAKGGAKFYVSNTVGVFSNAGFHAGFAGEKYNAETYGDLSSSISRRDFYVELGVAVDF